MSEYAEIVAALRSVPGVAHAGVEPEHDSGDGLGLLRIGLEAGADEAAVTARVGRLLREQFGLGVDADQVQLIEDSGEAEIRPRGAGQLAVSRMQLVSAGLDVTARVETTFRGQSAIGQATGTATQSGVHRAVAGATLRALEGLLGSRARFELELVEIVGGRGGRRAQVQLTMVSEEGTEQLSGTAIVRDDARQAVLRAVIDAVGRSVEPLLE